MSGQGSSLSELEKSRVAEAWTACMADAGLKGQIQLDGGINIGVEVPDGISDEEVRQAEAECEPLLSPVDASFDMDPDDQARLIDASADIQRCLAEAGYDVTMVDGGVEMNSDDQPDGFDEATYLEAEDDCYREIVPDLHEKYAGG